MNQPPFPHRRLAWYGTFGISAADIYDNDIRTDLLNIFIGDTDIRLSAEDVKEFISAVDEYFAYLSAALVKFQIGNSSQFFTIPHIDYIFAF